MRKLLLLVFVLLAALAIGGAWAWQRFGQLGLAAVLVVLAFVLLAVKMLGGRLLARLFTAPFRAKGKVLHDASVEINGVYHAPEPAPEHDPAVDDEDEEEVLDYDPSWSWFFLDVTIRPLPTAADGKGFTLWEPGELLLVGPDASPVPGEDEAEDEDAHCVVHEVDVWHDDAFRVDEQGKYEGPQRLRMHIGLPPGDRHRLQFRYYFELFGRGQLIVRE